MKCEICGEIAKSICLECNQYYCDLCFKFIHEKKKNYNHKKEHIDNFIPIQTKCSIHSDVPMNLFCLTEKELFCSVCQIINPHKDHKIILISDEESLKKENLTLDTIKCSFDINNKEINELTQEIEKEKNKISNLYENTNNEIVKYFEEKHKQLIDEEEKLKDKLKNEVNKVKDKLEKFLFECKKIINLKHKIKKWSRKNGKRK